MTRIRSSNSSMIDDRRGRGGRGGGFSLPGMGGRGRGGGMGIPIRTGGGLVGILIVLAATLLPRMLSSGAGTSNLGGGGNPPAEVADGTCSSEIEQIVCGATVDVQEYWQTALPQFMGQQYEATKTVFFSGGTDTGCGSATSETGPFYCPVDRLVYIDLGFMQQLEERLIGTTSDLAEQYIVAHEYGHHVQNLLGTNAEVQRASQNDPDRANQYSIALELQADCYAGAWVADVAARNGLESANEIAEALAAAEGVGDDRIQQRTQGRVDPESWNHGSSEQRQTWFRRGYDTGDPSRCNTFDEVL